MPLVINAGKPIFLNETIGYSLLAIRSSSFITCIQKTTASPCSICDQLHGFRMSRLPFLEDVDDERTQGQRMPNTGRDEGANTGCDVCQNTERDWVKGHDDNYGNERADALADAGRNSNTSLILDDKEWTDSHPALQDGARLQALEAENTYEELLKWYTRKITPIPRQEILNDAKDQLEEVTGLRPTNEKLLKGIKALGIPPRIKDHMRCMLTGRIKCGTFWNNIPRHEGRALCSFCIRKEGTETIETEQHLWLECEHNGQNITWETARNIWRKTTPRSWPNLSLGLIRGTPAIGFENDPNKDSERLRILISLPVWAIWKSRNKSSINNQDVSPNEMAETLRNIISDLVRKSWNANKFMENRARKIRQRKLRILWADIQFADFDHTQGPTVDFI